MITSPMLRVLLLAPVLCALADLRLSAIVPAPYSAPISFSFLIAGTGSGLMTVYGESTESVSESTYGTWTESDNQTVWLRPNRKYSFNFQWSGVSEYGLSFIAPTGFTVYIDGVSQDMLKDTPTGPPYSVDHTVEIRPQESSPGEAASFSGIDIGKGISWRVGLGRLRNGRSAGHIVFNEPDLASDPANLDKLVFTWPLSVLQDTVLFDGPSLTRLRQLMTAQCFVDFQIDGATYWLKFWDPANAAWNTGTLQYDTSGSPWKTIHVESPAANQLKITEVEGTTTQVSMLSLTSGTVSSGNYVWELKEGDGTAWLRTTRHTSSTHTVSPATVVATGGSVSTAGGFTLHTFTSSGTFVLNTTAVVDTVLVGGGGGGATNHAGGGGAGGLIVYNYIAAGANNYPVVVGAGGSGNTGYDAFGTGFDGQAGSSSSVFGLTAYGGGQGGTPGGSGGSGGGSGYPDPTLGGLGTVGQGNAGNVSSTGDPLYGGGGGGAGSPGTGSNGGLPVATWAGTFAGGGGGGYIGGWGGGGGAGNGGYLTANGGNASANSGSGGGGGGSSAGLGGNGGSGVVVIRYPSPMSAYRDDVVEVFTGTTSGTLVAKSRYRYADQSWGEELVEMVADPDGTAPLKTTYTYNRDPYSPGNYRKVSSITYPTGNWTSYLYFNDWYRRGQLQVQSGPWQSSATTVQPASASIGHSYTYDYAPDYTGRYRLPNVTGEYVSGQQVGKSAATSTVANVRDGQPYTQLTEDGYSDSTNYARTITQYIQADANPDYAGETYMIRRPDLTQDSHAYYYGTYNTSTKVFTIATPAADSYLQEIIWHGTSSYVAGGLLSSYGGNAIEPLYLVPNKSTVEVIIRNPAGLVVREETHIVSSGTSWALLSWVNYDYDAAGRLTDRHSPNGADSHSVIANGRVQSVTDELGTETTYDNYDVLGRVLTRTKGDATVSTTYPNQGAITTTYTYDGANRVKTETVSGGSGGGALSIVTTFNYDAAGRKTSEVVFSGSTGHSQTTAFAYDAAGRKVTTTLPGGATKAAEVYYDGQLKEITGTAVVPEAYAYSIESGTGRKIRVRTINSSSTRKSTSTFDWLARQVGESVPGGNGSPATQAWTYDSHAQLTRYSRTGYADVLYIYDEMGAKVCEGLDVNANGSLDYGGLDRISSTSYAIASWDAEVTWWLLKLNYVWATENSGTATQVSSSISRMNLPSGYLESGNDYDINGNVTYHETTFNRTNKLLTRSVSVARGAS